MKIAFFFSLILTVAFNCNVFCEKACSSEVSCIKPCDPSYFVFIPFAEYWVGDGRSYNDGYETIGSFFTKYNESFRSYAFFDISLHRVNQRNFASNVGIGLRHFIVDFAEFFGVNLFYDQRNIKNGSLHQIGLGAELIGRFWEMRVNGYLPVGRKRRLLETITHNYSGDFFAEVSEYNSALSGLDIEVGKWLCFSCFPNIFVGVGPYCYDSRSCCRASFLGGMWRLETFFWKYFSAQLLVTYDRVFHTKVQGQIGLFIPITCLKECWNCLFQRVYRNEIIATDRLCCWRTNF